MSKKETIKFIAQMIATVFTAIVTLPQSLALVSMQPKNIKTYEKDHLNLMCQCAFVRLPHTEAHRHQHRAAD